MSNHLNDKFVAAIKQHIPPGHTMFSSLMEILSLGREAIYRRLRSEVPFTFEEVIKISLHLGISLDKLTDKTVLHLIADKDDAEIHLH